MSADRCPCGDRERSQCPGAWEQGCDLGANPAYAERSTLTGAEVDASLAVAPAAPAAEPDGWEANAAYLLDRCPFTVRQRPGGGPEDLLSSLVVTFMGMQQRLTAPEAAPAQSREPLTADPDKPHAVNVPGYGWVDVRAVRAIERAHGIGSQP